jgi:hypothetical protein
MTLFRPPSLIRFENNSRQLNVKLKGELKGDLKGKLNVGVIRSLMEF